MATSQLNSHQVDILFNSEPNPICAGTLISSYLVLTVFSCLNGKNETKLKVRVSNGNDAMDSDNYQKRLINVDEIHSYPARKSDSSEHDIALIVLDPNFQFNKSVSPLKIIDHDSNEWADLIALSSPSCGDFSVQKARESDCVTKDGNFSSSVCVKKVGESSCPFLAIGSGLICKVEDVHFLCGALASKTGNFGVYTNIYKYRHWIHLAFEIGSVGDNKNNAENPNEFGLAPVIFSGHEVTSPIPYQLSLQIKVNQNWRHICGAVIIDIKTALTASHCFIKNYNVNDYRVVAGVTRLDSNSTTKQILLLQKVIRHPEYKILNLFKGNDIAILHVAGSFVFNDNVQNIWISPPNGTNSTDFRSRVSGWGKTSNNGGVSKSLQEVDMKILLDSECSKFWPKLLIPSMICSFDNVSNVCAGDSGGPLVVKSYQFNTNKTQDLLVGIASFSHEDCDKQEMPNGFTEVSHFLDWIQENRALKCGDSEFRCLNGGCIDECSLCSGIDECGDGSTEKQCEEKMDLTKMKMCLRKNQQQLKNIIHSQNQTINKLEEQLKNLSLTLSEDPVFPAAGFSTTSKKSNDSSLSFSADLYEAVKESQPQNFVLSALSVRNSLAMLSLGAKGETAEEIQKVLQLSDDKYGLIRGQSNLTSSLKRISSGNSGVKLVTADKIYVKSGLVLRQLYQKDMEKLGGEIESMEFSNTRAAAKNINSWVQNKTAGKIEKLVEASDLTRQTSLLILNSIYFKGSWENKFDSSSTRKTPFFINGSCSVNVSMMYQKNKFQLADLQDAKSQVLILPYKGKRLSMLIYLPNEESSLDSLENWLADKSPFDIPEQHLNQSSIGDVSVSLPKFKMRSSLNLNEPLKKLGLGKMFEPRTANFSGMFYSFGNLHVSQVSQETFIEVNEEGTEAAAATSIKIVTTSFSPTPQFTADRPFVFQIVDSTTKTVLFSGRVKNPLDSGESAASAGQTNEPTCVKSQPAEHKKRNEAEFPLNTGKPCDQGNSQSFPPAAASGLYWRVSSNSVPDWNYDSTKGRSCFPFAGVLRSVYINGSSCVTLYKDESCKEEKLRMITTTASLGQDIRFSNDDEEIPKSIGVCSSF